MNITRSGRPREGTVIDIPGRGLCEVLSNDDPATILFRAPSGAEFRIGERALALALLAAEGVDE